MWCFWINFSILSSCLLIVPTFVFEKLANIGFIIFMWTFKRNSVPNSSSFISWGRGWLERIILPFARVFHSGVLLRFVIGFAVLEKENKYCFRRDSPQTNWKIRLGFYDLGDNGKTISWIIFIFQFFFEKPYSFLVVIFKVDIFLKIICLFGNPFLEYSIRLAYYL